MLSLVTDRFEVITVDVDERSAEIRMEEEGVPALRVSEGLAELKAKAVFETLSDSEKENTIVIGADTSVVLDNIIFGKPKDRQEAVDMLSLLSGKTHVVATGVAVFAGSKVKRFTEETYVEFNALDDYQRELIEAYCDGGSPYDKAGGYGIQDKGALLVKCINGDYSNVVGLPVPRLAREISGMLEYSLE